MDFEAATVPLAQLEIPSAVRLSGWRDSGRLRWLAAAAAVATLGVTLAPGGNAGGAGRSPGPSPAEMARDLREAAVHVLGAGDVELLRMRTPAVSWGGDSLETSGPAAPDLETSGPAAPDLETSGPAAPDLETSGPAAPDLETSGPAAPDLPIRLGWKADGTEFVDGSALPPLPPDRTYQLWALVDTQRVSVGVLGRRPGVVPFSARIAAVRGFSLTDEPARGAGFSVRAPLAYAHLRRPLG